MITRTMLKWADKKYEEGEAEGKYSKIIASGFVEGLVDGSVIMYPVMVAACVYWKRQALKK